MQPNYIETHAGLAFYPFDPNPYDIRIEDIAHALSNQCRFSGHTKVFYSVAEHCVRVSQLIDSWNLGPTTDAVFWGLLHDASEAYLVDIPTPLKRMPEFAEYRKAEQRLMQVICRKFGLQTKEPIVVRMADEVLLATEARDLMPFKPEHWGSLTQDALRERIVPWSSETAERLFLGRFTNFFGRSA